MENQLSTAENKATYYYNNGQRIPLRRESSIYAVKFVTGARPSRRFFVQACVSDVKRTV
jgi:hypothetical protein